MFRRRLSLLRSAPLMLLALAALARHDAARAAGSLLLLDDPPEAATWQGGLSVRGWPSAHAST